MEVSSSTQCREASHNRKHGRELRRKAPGAKPKLGIRGLFIQVLLPGKMGNWCFSDAWWNTARWVGGGGVLFGSPEVNMEVRI